MNGNRSNAVTDHAHHRIARALGRVRVVAGIGAGGVTAMLKKLHEQQGSLPAHARSAVHGLASDGVLLPDARLVLKPVLYLRTCDRVARISATAEAPPLFKCLQCRFLLRMVTGPGGQLHIAQFLQLAADGSLVEQHRELFVEPMREIDQPPVHDAMDRWGRPALHRTNQGTSLRIIDDRRLDRCLSIQQPIRTVGNEADPQSRTSCKVTPPIRAASLRLPPL